MRLYISWKINKNGTSHVAWLASDVGLSRRGALNRQVLLLATCVWPRLPCVRILLICRPPRAFWPLDMAIRLSIVTSLARFGLDNEWLLDVPLQTRSIYATGAIILSCSFAKMNVGTMRRFLQYVWNDILICRPPQLGVLESSCVSYHLIACILYLVSRKLYLVSLCPMSICAYASMAR